MAMRLGNPLSARFTNCSKLNLEFWFIRSCFVWPFLSIGNPTPCPRLPGRSHSLALHASPGVTWGWRNDAYLHSFVLPRDPMTNLFDLKRYFYSGGDTANTTSGAFYYWKRRYKYIMNRWGYSVNIPIIEPFNEIDQILTYQDVTATELCAENNIHWVKDDGLPAVINQWVTDIAQFVRGDVDLYEPARSPLGYSKKLFLMSYALSEPGRPDADSFYAPFFNDEVDLIDAHRGMWPNVTTDRDHPDSRIRQAYGEARNFMDGFLPQVVRKPFNQGEHNYYTFVKDIPGWSEEVEKIFHNYDVSFHNEIWASAFSGKFASGCTWEKRRVFWWNLKNPPSDPNNGYQPPSGPFTPQFSNALGAVNMLSVNGNPVPITNKRIVHHFSPLSDFLSQAGTLAPGGLFDLDFTAHLAFDETGSDELEAYYLVDDTKVTALGWVHNRNAWAGNNFYARSYSSDQNFLGCTVPAGATINMDGFEPFGDYTILWTATRMNSTVAPAPMEATADASGNISLNLSGEFGGIANDYLDTLRADYAFMAFSTPHLRLQQIVETPPDAIRGGTLQVYPNPAWQEAMVVLPNDGTWTLSLLDITGREVHHVEEAIGGHFFLSVQELASGTYLLQAHQATQIEHAKLIVR